MKRLLWYLIAGTKGGINRARIIRLLHDRPSNANQITEKLGLDYKTVKHHLGVLEDNDVILAMGKKKYGTMYFLTQVMEDNYDTFKDIWDQIKEE